MSQTIEPPPLAASHARMAASYVGWRQARRNNVSSNRFLIVHYFFHFLIPAVFELFLRKMNFEFQCLRVNDGCRFTNQTPGENQINTSVQHEPTLVKDVSSTLFFATKREIRTMVSGERSALRKNFAKIKCSGRVWGSPWT